MLNDPLTCEGKMAWKDDVNSSTVQVKHNAKVDGYASQNGKTVDKGPVGRIQGDLKAARIQKSSSYHITKWPVHINDDIKVSLARQLASDSPEG